MSTTRPLALLVLVLALAAPARADLFGQAPPEDAAATSGPRVYQPRAPFVIGRDNLAFVNPAGAVTVKTMAGNCYTMALVTKMFHRLARYDAAAAPPGFDPDALVAAARAGYGRGAFAVRGYPDLHALTTVPGMSPGRVTRWMEEEARARRGLAPAAPRERPAQADALVHLYEAISTIHYLHYLQHSAGTFLRRALDSYARASAPGEITRAAIARLKEDLPRGELGLFLLFNPAVQFGHVVLAYKVEAHPDHDDVYLYDNNTQVAGFDDETVARVDRETGAMAMFLKDAASGELRPDPSWAQSSWWDPARQFATLLPDPNHAPGLRAELADKLAHAPSIAGTLHAVGDGLKAVTRRPPGTGPGESTLARDVTEMIVALQAVHGTDFVDRELAPDADVVALNAYLGATSDRIFEEIFPYTLPRDVDIEGTHIRFDARDPNRGWIDLTLRVEKGAALDEVVASLRKSALFAGEPACARLIQGVGEAFEGEALTAHLRLRITKQVAPPPMDRIGTYAPVPFLEASHVVVGSLEHTLRLGRDADHRVELAEGVAAGLAAAALRSRDLLGKTFSFDYRVDIPLTGGSRTGSVTLRGVTPSFHDGWMKVSTSLAGFAPVMTETRGVSFASRDLALWLRFHPTEDEDVFRLSGELSGAHGIRLGLGKWIDGWVLKGCGALLGRFFPRFSGALDTLLRSLLARWGSVPAGGVRLGTPTLTASALRAPLARLEVDFAGTVRKLFGQDALVKIRDVRFEEGRMVLLLDYR